MKTFLTILMTSAIALVAGPNRAGAQDGVPLSIYTTQNSPGDPRNIGTHTFNEVSSKMPGQWVPLLGWQPIHWTLEETLNAAMSEEKIIWQRSFIVTSAAYEELAAFPAYSGYWRPIVANCIEEVKGPDVVHPLFLPGAGVPTLDAVEEAWAEKGYIVSVGETRIVYP